jgi:hypothetical protein
MKAHANLDCAEFFLDWEEPWWKIKSHISCWIHFFFGTSCFYETRSYTKIRHRKRGHRNNYLNIDLLWRGVMNQWPVTCVVTSRSNAVICFLRMRFTSMLWIIVGRGSPGGIATRYGRFRDRIPGWGGEIFRNRSDRLWCPHSLVHIRYRSSFPGVKRPGRGFDHPVLSSADVKERVELYIYPPLWAFVACSRVTFTFTFMNN